MLDDTDAAAWIAASFGEDALEYIFEPMLEGLYFQAPEQMSRAWPAIVWNFGMQRKSVTVLAGGSGSLPEALAQRVKVCFSTPAKSIDITGSGVKVETPSGFYTADYVVLATPATTASQLYMPEHKLENRLVHTDYSATINISFGISNSVSTAKVPKDVYGLLIPRRERRVIAAIGIESRKCKLYVPRGELLNVMLCGTAGNRLLNAPEERVLAEVLPELQRYFPGIDNKIEFTHFCRWAQAEPRSPIGRSHDLQQYRQHWHPSRKVILAGDYMSIPCTEGAAESGKWAANALAAATIR
jgi:oxygen-dependent protoporphyrinogen oxidase